ncbi:MAG: AAA family ATPase, partial [Psychrobacillus psychrotolerans]|uniref:AAA family ATPase n=1 Tax=Psychrobacillus psychrotolerans TaxID=126156 RepID=UPI003BAFCC97
MLVYFKVGNFKSIKEPVVINFNATSIREHQDTNVIKIGEDSFLRTVLLYGPNAGGKSNILDALAFFRWSVINSATDKQSDEEINTEAFALNTVTFDQPSYFEAEFIVDKTKYRYGFEADKEAVRKEWLMEVKVTTDTPIFLRIGQEFQIDNKKFKDGGGLGKRTRKNALFLSVAAQWNVQKAEEINKWFKSIIT